MKDFISRQDALDCICNLPWNGYIADAVIEDAEAELKKLPSAQPEIIRCMECIHWRKLIEDVETCSEHRNVDGTEQATDPADYCSWAERRGK